ncbi:flagellar basal body rod C-terminal domain-containing protein [Chitinimonas lacunae]|uniref:Flagellar basal body rod C-terminal domain-containing protein n=1 Tax=Chitinimonas lacunae TaxID=1963018 RepID=A0ABV8MV93_9NEIS
MAISGLGAGLSGMQHFQRGLEVSASRIAGWTPQETQGADLASETVQSLVNKTGFQASAQMVKTADDMLGTLIDIRA